VVERPLVPGGGQIPVIPHLGHIDGPAGLRRPLLDDPGPVAPPLLLAAGLVVDAVQHMIVAQGVVEHPIDKSLLEGQDRPVVALVRRGEKNGCRLAAGWSG